MARNRIVQRVANIINRFLFRNGIVAELHIPKFRESGFAVAPNHVMAGWQSGNAFD